ncbi:hypothetical protein TNCV_4385341 [Trichonephila clavipes]|nr:hypothetical protein TNCV_4385341 [Trichonephila clavipes]
MSSSLVPLKTRRVGGRYTLNLSKLKRPPIDVVRKTIVDGLRNFEPLGQVMRMTLEPALHFYTDCGRESRVVIVANLWSALSRSWFEI